MRFSICSSSRHVLSISVTYFRNILSRKSTSFGLLSRLITRTLLQSARRFKGSKTHSIADLQVEDHVGHGRCFFIPP